MNSFDLTKNVGAAPSYAPRTPAENLTLSNILNHVVEHKARLTSLHEQLQTITSRLVPFPTAGIKPSTAEPAPGGLIPVILDEQDETSRLINSIYELLNRLESYLG